MKKIIKKLTLLAIIMLLIQGVFIVNAKIKAAGVTHVRVDLGGGSLNASIMDPNGMWSKEQDGKYSRPALPPTLTVKTIMSELDGNIIPPAGMVFNGWDHEPEDVGVGQSVLFVAKWKPASASEPVEVKDERCEVVIGPTWHWNNDLGVCEEYAVVATSTR